MWICISMDHSFSLLGRPPDMITLLSVLLFSHQVCLHLFAGLKTYARVLEFLSSVCLEMEVTTTALSTTLLHSLYSSFILLIGCLIFPYISMS